ncbi:MAG: DUF4194 domain-containing protein [Bacilli bacterium]|nr:DUF4194 domain-containing protein [Bacilli bacterium]
MWNEKYDLLTNNEKERFTKIVNYILNKTFLFRETYEEKDRIGKISADYRFFERNFELFQDYLDIAGYSISKDDAEGIISITNIYFTNLLRVDKFTTLFLLTLRQMYDEEKEKAPSSNAIFVRGSDIIIRMIDNKLLTKKPTIKDMTDVLRLLIRHNVIAKFDGNIEDSNVILTIYPTILKVVSNEKITAIYDNMFKKDDDNDEKTDDIPFEA